MRTDVSKKSEVEAAVAATIKQFGRLDMLVNNASKLSPNVLLEQKTDEMLQATLGVERGGPGGSCSSPCRSCASRAAAASSTSFGRRRGRRVAACGLQHDKGRDRGV